jgi:hypothetical protein
VCHRPLCAPSPRLLLSVSLHSPASADTLASLWYRYFGCGDAVYLDRLLALTKLTGAPAYQAEKDIEIREWHAKKTERAVREAKEARKEEVEAAKKLGKPAPAAPAADAAAAVTGLDTLPASPTLQLHYHFFNSLLHFSVEHPSVGLAVKRAWSLDPKNAVIQELLKTTPFKITP